MQSELKDITIGSTFEQRFIIEAILGQGGNGVVFRAHHTQLGKAVALKIMLGSFFTDEGLRKRFVREIKSVGALEHENIVKTLASGLTADGRPWVAMELLNGVPLDTVLRENGGKLEHERAFRILRQVAAGLAYAHSHDIIHRDIKPSNVMLVQEGDNEKALIVDFGLAKNLSQAQTQTATTLQGSPYYMSPEQCQTQTTDARTDVYAFGCMMFEMLTGKPPFDGESPYAIMFSHIHDTAPQVNPIVAKCLSKDPNDRYVNGTELLIALTDTEAVQTRKRRPAKRARRRSMAVGVTVSIIVIAAVSYVVLERPFVSRVLNVQAASVADSIGGIPKAADKQACDALTLDQQMRIAEYWKLRTDAVFEDVKPATPEIGAKEAVDLILEMRDCLRPNKNGNEWYKTPVYDLALAQSLRVINKIRSIEPDLSDKATQAIMDLALWASTRAIFGGAHTLLTPSFEATKLARRLRTEPGSTMYTDDFLFRHYIQFGNQNHSPMERKLCCHYAKDLVPKIVSAWERSDPRPEYVMSRQAHFALIKYLEGNVHEAQTILRQEVKAYMHSAERTAEGDPEYISSVQHDFQQAGDQNFALKIMREEGLLK